MFVVALLTIAKNWKQQKCALCGEWINMCGAHRPWKTSQQKAGMEHDGHNNRASHTCVTMSEGPL